MILLTVSEVEQWGVYLGSYYLGVCYHDHVGLCSESDVDMMFSRMADDLGLTIDVEMTMA